MGYSPIQDAVLAHLRDTGEIPTQLNGKTVRSTTVEALERRGSIRLSESGYTLTEQGQKRVGMAITENLEQRRTRYGLRWHDTWSPTYDYGQPDYEWWDRASRGKAKGLEIAGLLLKPLASKKAAWVLGQIPQFKFPNNPELESKVAQWWEDNHARILAGFEQSCTLGDSFVVVNGDSSATVVPPHVAQPLVNEQDYSIREGWMFRQVYQHPNGTDSMTIDDIYTKSERIRVRYPSGKQGVQQRYRNLLPGIPVVHIGNNRDSNEAFGHPEGEALVPALHAYGEIFDSAFVGNRRQGRPTPTLQFTAASDTKEFFDKYAKKKVQKQDDGSYEEYYEINIDADKLIAGTGKFAYAQPGSFTSDTETLLQLLFYLILQHTEYPEFIWGNAIASSKASAETQLPPFVKWVEKERGKIRDWILRVTELVIGWISLTDPAMASGEEEFTLQWGKLTDEDGRLTLDAIQVALRFGGLEMDELLPYLPVDLKQEEIDTIIKRIEADREEFNRLDKGMDEPFVPALPSGDDTGTQESIIHRYADSLLEQVEAQEGYAYIDLANHPELIRVQSQLMDALPAVNVRKENPDNLHITLVYALNIAGEQFEQAVIPEFESFRVRVIGIGMFETPDGGALHLVVDRSQALVDLQMNVNAEMTDAIVKSGFSEPLRWQPHITMAYIPSGVAIPPIEFEPFEIEVNRVIYARDNYETAFTVQAREAVSG